MSHASRASFRACDFEVGVHEDRGVGSISLCHVRLVGGALGVSFNTEDCSTRLSGQCRSFGFGGSVAGQERFRNPVSDVLALRFIAHGLRG